MNPLFAVMNNRELLVISSATTSEIAPDVPPVIVSPFTNALPKYFLPGQLLILYLNQLHPFGQIKDD